MGKHVWTHQNFMTMLAVLGVKPHKDGEEYCAAPSHSISGVELMDCARNLARHDCLSLVETTTFNMQTKAVDEKSYIVTSYLLAVDFAYPEDTFPYDAKGRRKAYDCIVKLLQQYNA